MSKLHRPCSDHLLSLHRDPREVGPPLSDCHLCGLATDGRDSFYSCGECGVCLHKRCADAPSQIQQHPLHSHHPLKQIPQTSEEFTCGACSVQLNADLVFECEECGFSLDLDCALSTLPDGEDNSITKEEELPMVRHPFDEHPLTSFFAKWQLPIPCRVCKAGIEGEACCCISCKFFLHRECLEWPREIRHPLHGEHSLSLSAGDFVSCSFCGSREPFKTAYGCSECGFFIDLGCAVNVDPVKVGKGTRDARILCGSHKRELVTFCAKEQTSIKCRICGSALLGEFLCCADCDVYVHRCCVTAPEQLQNPLHPHHPRMALYIDTLVGSICSSCSLSLENELAYRCKCGWSVHRECGLRTLAYYEEGADLEIKLLWHDHPVYLCHKTGSSADFCDGCGHVVEGPSYSCVECPFFLHKSCLALAPEIEHPHHPNHQLYRRRESSFRELHYCGACNERIMGSHFSCRKCTFFLDMRCASIFPTVKHELHEHKLSYLEKNKVFSPCHRCGNDNGSAIFRCVPCNFNLHPDCSKLPRTVMHRSHWHSLTLYELYLEDDSGEYYCDICEKLRNPENGVYVCEGCKAKAGFYAHIECVLPCANVKSRLDSALVRADERIAKLEEKVLVKKKELDALVDELEEARAERAAIISQKEL